MPHNDGGIFGPSCQFCAIMGEFAEPYFIAVFSENLLCVAGELFPKTIKTFIRYLMLFYSLTTLATVFFRKY